MKVIEALHKYICDAGKYNSNSELPPKVILWPDGERLFEKCIPLLLKEIPELLIYGKYKPEDRTGPAIWLRCAVAKTVVVELPDDKIPIIYLPGISRDDLHVERKIDEIKPLIPLQYMGKFFSQRSAKDITPLALFSGKDYLGLSVVEGNDTRDALRAAIDIALEQEVNDLKNISLDEAYFNKMITGGDPLNIVLGYIDCETDYFENKNDIEKQAIVNTFENQFKFNPLREGRFRAAELLAKHESIEWKNVWNHYLLSYTRFNNIEKVIRSCSSYSTPLIGGKEYEGWPQYNDEQESELLQQLKALQDKTKSDIYKKIDSLYQDHKERLDYIWAKKGESPILNALVSFKQICDFIRNNSFGSTLNEISHFYQKDGCEIDFLVIQILSNLNKDEHKKLFNNLLKIVYVDGYLDVLTQKFQEVAKEDNYPYKEIVCNYSKDTCILFADGLRYDLAKHIATSLDLNYQVEENPTWVPFPSITQCGKYAVSPVVKELAGLEPEDFSPCIKDNATPVTNTNFKTLLEAKGWQYVENASIKEKDFGWYPFGDLDNLGHKLGDNLPSQIESKISEIETKIHELLNAGWTTVILVTDHGWLFVPGNMPKCKTTPVMLDSHKDRYSLVQAGENSGYPQVPWSWNKEYQVATPNGIGSFVDGKVYSHGGLSLQECLTLQLTISKKEVNKGHTLSIKNIKWKGMACTFEIEGCYQGLYAEIRISPADEKTAVSSKKNPYDEDGYTRLIVTEDNLDGKKAFIIITDDSKQLLYQHEVIIGEN